MFFGQVFGQLNVNEKGTTPLLNVKTTLYISKLTNVTRIPVTRLMALQILKIMAIPLNWSLLMESTRSPIIGEYIGSFLYLPNYYWPWGIFVVVWWWIQSFKSLIVILISCSTVQYFPTKNELKKVIILKVK